MKLGIDSATGAHISSYVTYTYSTGNAQAESGIALAIGFSAIGLYEFPETPAAKHLWHAAAVIGHRQPNSGLDHMQMMIDRAARRRKLDRVRQKIGDPLRDTGRQPARGHSPAVVHSAQCHSAAFWLCVITPGAPWALNCYAADPGRRRPVAICRPGSVRQRPLPVPAG